MIDAITQEEVTTLPPVNDEEDELWEDYEVPSWLR